MSIVFQKPYSFLLIENGSEWFLTYFTDGPVELDICVQLNEEEIKLASTSQEAVEALMARFKADKSLIEGRRIIPSVIK
jgi:hypothetical protein